MCKTNKTIPDDSLGERKNNLKEEPELTRNETNLSQHMKVRKIKLQYSKSHEITSKGNNRFSGKHQKTTSQKQHQQEW